MRCEYMVDNQVQFSYSRSPGNPICSERVRLSRSAISADEELELHFRSFGEFEKFCRWINLEMFRAKEVFIERAKARKGGKR